MFNLTGNEEVQLIEDFYRQQVAQAASDEEELQIALTLLEKSKHGYVIRDDGRLMLLQNFGIPVDAPWQVPDPRAKQGIRGLALPLLILLALAAFTFVPMLIDKTEPAPAPEPTAPVAVVPATQTLTPTTGPLSTETPLPTTTPTPTPLPTLTPTPLPPEEVEIKPEPVKLEPGAVIPVSLEIAGRYFPIVPTTLRDQTWAYQPDPGQASWLAGSAVNVVLGLPYSDENLHLVNSLALSSTLSLRTNAGGVLTYSLAERRRVDVYQIEVLGQRRAGLTLILLAGDEEAPDGGPDRRLVLWATASTWHETGKEVQTQTTG